MLPERMIRLRDENGLESACTIPVRPEHLQLVETLHVEVEGPLAAVDLPLECVSSAQREAGRLDGAHRAALELGGRLDGVVHLPPWDEGAQEASDRLDLTYEIAGEIDDVRGEVAQGSRAGGPTVEPPDLLGRVAPVLQIATPEVTKLPELARLDHLAREPHCRDEAVVERAHVLHARGRDTTPDVVALVRIPSERLLANDVLAGFGGGDGRRRVQVVGTQVVEEPDRRVRHELLPVRRPALEAVARRGLGDRLLVPPAIATSRG